MKGNLKGLLSDIGKGKDYPFIVLHGDDFQVHDACKAILDVISPTEQRAFNLERFDGRSTPWDQIEAALKTPPLFPGRKTVLIENAPYFFSRERKGELTEKVLQLWGEEKKDEAARLFLDLMVLEGVTQAQWKLAQDSPSEPQVNQLLSKGADGDLEPILAFCLSQGMELSVQKRDRILKLMEEGVPPWAVLLIIASHVDRRTQLYRRLEEKGAVLDLSLNREKSGRIKPEMLGVFLEQRLREAGKRIEPQAREMILARAGDELWAFHQEIEKLFLYVGESPGISAQDVDEAFLDQAEAWVFDLTNSIAKRDAIRSLGHLRRLLFQGDHALRLLATIVNQVRQLLTVRHLIESEMRTRWRKGMSFAEFQRKVLQQGGPFLTRNPYGDYMRFQSAENFTTQELVRYLNLIYKTDIRLKSTGIPSRMVMERLILEMCQGRDERTPRHEDKIQN
ncbi:MAG: DNA polymerase III subunit delta [Deltaproteobacteria bacterium]|nr:DNA polymerase III subunit delta [Deltaproteobacteria bacterium]